MYPLWNQSTGHGNNVQVSTCEQREEAAQRRKFSAASSSSFSSSSFCSPQRSAVAGPPAPCAGLGPGDLLNRNHPAVESLHARLALRHLPLPPPLLLLLLLLQLQVLGHEEGDGGGVNVVVTSQRRHHQERSPGSHVTDRDCSTMRPGHRCWPRPRKWSLLCP